MRLFSGQRAWLLQRFTAVLLFIATTTALAALAFSPPFGYAQWKAVFSDGHGATLTLVCYVAMCVHGWVGARDIILDYVQPAVPRLVLLALVALLLLATSVRLALVIAAQFAR